MDDERIRLSLGSIRLDSFFSSREELCGHPLQHAEKAVVAAAKSLWKSSWIILTWMTFICVAAQLNVSAFVLLLYGIFVSSLFRIAIFFCWRKTDESIFV